MYTNYKIVQSVCQYRSYRLIAQELLARVSDLQRACIHKCINTCPCKITLYMDIVGTLNTLYCISYPLLLFYFYMSYNIATLHTV